jgi:glycosyltransferase involved in cell wall biosynthesis
MNAPADYWVMVPFYSNVGYLRETMRSVLAQTDLNWRAIIVDDSLVDPGVQSLVDQLGDARVSVTRNPTNLGVAGSFNRCFELAVEHGAELAMILHADDLLEPQYVATVRVAHAESPDAACVATKVTVIGANGSPRRTVPDTVKTLLWPRHRSRLEGDRGLGLLLRGQFFYCPGVSYRLAEIAMPAWNARRAQVMDLELYGRILLNDGSIALEQRRVFRYRRHEQSMTQLNSATMLRTVEETDACRSLAAEARQRGWTRAARAGHLRPAVRLQGLMRVSTLAILGQFRSAGRAFMLAVRP